VETFTRACALGQRAAHDGRWERAFEILADAIVLWRGDPLADIPAHISLAGWIEQIRETRTAAVETRIEAGLRLGLHEQLIVELRTLVAEHPLRERIHAHLVTALAGTGRQAEALAAYQDARRVVITELGVEPGPELRLLQERVLAGDAGLLDPLRHGGTTGPTLSAVVPRRLPAAPGLFAGREAELTSLTELVQRQPRSGAAVVISVVGDTAGIGKTALAVHFAHQVADRFPDGQLYVDLRGTSNTPDDPTEALASLLRDLGEPDGAIPPDPEGRAARYRSLTSRRRLLLVVDDARDAEQVRPLLPGGEACAVLVTSRRHLPGLVGAVPVRLDGLASSEALELLTSLVGSARVRAEPESVQRVLSFCGGLPLALRIAAAALASRPAWTVATLAGRLADEHRRLQGTHVEDVPVRASVRMIYTSLAELEDSRSVSAARAFGLLETLVDANLLEAFAPGRHRFHDLVRDFAGEVADDGEPPDTAPALKRFPSGPAQLPGDLMDFTGRHVEVADLVRLVGADSGDGPARPVVISAVTGTGGVGKTTLAVHVGHKLLAGYPDGQLYVNLGGVSESPRDPAEVLATLLRDLGEPDEAVPPDEQGRAARFRTLTSTSRLLIVLDDARDAAQVRPLLPGSGRCAVLVTSRRRLAGLAGAVPLHLDVLEPSEALDLFTSLVGRARADAEPEAVEQVLAHCGGLPLAVRIAAARLASRPTWTVAALAVRLTDERHRLDELQVEDVAVRASFHMSYRSLAEHEDRGGVSPARAFCLVGLIPGPDFTVPAAAALLDLSADQVEDLLEGLVDVNLLEAVSPGRYRLHDLLRDFARELAAQTCSPADCSQAVAGMVGWYVHSTAAATDHLNTRRVRWGLDQVPAPSTAIAFADRDGAWRWLLAERINLAAAITAAEQYLPGPEAWVLAAQALHFYEHRSLWSEMHQTHVIGLLCARRLGDVRGCSRMLTGITYALTRMHRFDEALDAAGQGVVAAEQAGDIKLVAAAHVNYAVSLKSVGRTEEAAAAYRTSLKVMRDIGEPQPLAATLINFGITLRDDVHHHDEADACFEEAVALAHTADSPLTAGYAMTNMAESRRLQGDTDAEIRLLIEAAAIRDRLGDHGGLAENLESLADALLRSGRMDEARSEWLRATELLHEIGDVGVTERRSRLSENLGDAGHAERP
jgi:tetratricopeptide (TPR) repeat protein